MGFNTSPGGLTRTKTQRHAQERQLTRASQNEVDTYKMMMTNKVMYPSVTIKFITRKPI